MSSQPPSSSRRRRIAGERRGRTIEGEPAVETPQAESSRKPLSSSTTETTPVKMTKTAKLSKTAKPSKTVKQSKTTTEAETAPVGTTSSEPARSGWWGSRASLGALGALLGLVLLLAGLAALGLLGTDGVEDVNEADATERALRTAPAAAEAAATAILAYDFKTLEADQDAATRFMTDDFGSEYSETFEKVVLPAAEENQAKVTATVRASSVMRATDDTARVLLFVDQATVSRANERPQIALNRVEISMEREGDKWLVADISSY